MYYFIRHAAKNVHLDDGPERAKEKMRVDHREAKTSVHTLPSERTPTTNVAW